ncbi:TPA: pilus ancillary protein 1 [Streptococcus pyogenes]|uniref:pilus ancillary protein 1 n=1 Tax=Streptococcus pyogenes TaxID=1314 RepID=UPI0010A123AD|nr:pilus ancillary protein 1 [Streptococcus pyogenes]VGS40783.1 collagen binding protein [Streptococcus pyogenes]VGS87860.1 collagen binding protein [Streptococcus pyogenes]VGU71685.1 collagen binding protein [Streptococcus pyogenes]VHI80949.1 collagen binding protein [Streptococcus pyogenes]VHJ20730.1 collagen binding protein [Streptococcus pyogenes]
MQKRDKTNYGSANNKRRQTTIGLLKVFLTFVALIGIVGFSIRAFGAEEQSVPNKQSSVQDYPWYGYDSYKGNLLRYHDLKVNLNGSKLYQVYCFNLKKKEPLREGSSNPNWYKKWDGNAENFKTFADNPREVGEELNANILRVLYNGYPNDANGIMKDIEPLNAILVTQNAIWYYSDNMLIFNADDFFISEAKDLNIQAPQLKLMREALKKLINPYSAGEEFRQVPFNFKLNIFESHDKTFQNLLSAEYVPDTPPKPGEEPPAKTEKTSVIIRKYAEGDYSKLLEGATLRLTGEDIPDFQEKVFQSNGTGEKIELSNGTYTLTETSSPDGYKIAEPIKFRVVNKKVFIVQKDGSQVENPNKEVAEPYSVEAYSDMQDSNYINPETFTPYGKFYYAKNKDKSSQVVYCFNADLHSPPESEDGGGTIDPDISTMKEVKYTHTAGSDLFKYALRPRDTNPEDFLKHIKKVIEKGYNKKGDSYNGLTETQFRAATQLAIYYFTDSTDLKTLKTYNNGKGYHGFESMDEKTLAVTKELINYAQDNSTPQLTNLDFFVPNNSKYQSLIGTEYHPDDLVDVIRMEDKKQEVIPVTHSLTVKKTVVGELGDKTKGFQFELELKDKTGQPIVNTLKTNNQDLVAKDGKYSFNLKHDDTIRIEGLPTGYSYTLKETETKDYIVTVDNKVSQEAQSVGKDITEDKEVTFENRKDLVPPTGLTTDGAIYLWLLLLVPLGLWVWLIGRKGLKND